MCENRRNPIFKCHWSSPVHKTPVCVRLMAWYRTGYNQFSEIMMPWLLTHKCFNQPQWVNIQIICDHTLLDTTHPTNYHSELGILYAYFMTKYSNAFMYQKTCRLLIMSLDSHAVMLAIRNACLTMYQYDSTLQLRHNEPDGAPSHRRHDCLFNCLFRCKSKKTSKLRVTRLCDRNSTVTGEIP